MYKGEWTSYMLGRLAEYGSATFQYGYDGLRTSKYANGVNTTYYYLNGKLLGEKRGSTNIQYVYDSNGIAGMVYGGNDYVFRKDIQGNVVAIYRGNTLMAQYGYDAWGRCKIVSESSGIGSLNPFRYRGYYYDSETGLYYLKTRYYDPETGRFLSPDTVDNLAPEEIGGLNLFAYCLNNPVMGYDPNGTWDWGVFWQGLGMVATAITAIALAATTFGAGIPLAMSIVAGVTLGAGILTGINGVATLVEAGTDYNFMRDGLFQGNVTAYNWYAGITEGVAAIGSMVLGVYHTTGQYKAAKYGQQFLGKGYKKVGSQRWVSADGMRQMIFDDTHHFLDGVRTTNHFNLYQHSSNMLLGHSPISYKLHVFYKLFEIWFR